jgi:acetyl esterase
MISLSYQRGHARLPHQSVAEVRQYYSRHQIAELKEKNYDELEAITGVPCRIHRPTTEIQKLLPTVIYLRASAYIFGTINDSDAFCQGLAKVIGCNVVAIEPHLAPEYKFPTQTNDCIGTIRYLVENHQVLNIDPSQIAIWGDSSGGNFAASISHQLNQEQSGFIQQQILFYPMLDYVNTNYPSKLLYEGYLMDEPLRTWFLSQYLTSLSESSDARVCPLLADSFTHLPRTLFIGAEYDPMRDEGQVYFENLQKSQVPSNALLMRGMVHGFLTYAAKLEPARYAQEYAANYLKEHFV